jgi:hypothetical protein
MIINAVGEVGNLVAYGYAEATVVTPIGAVGSCPSPFRFHSDVVTTLHSSTLPDAAILPLPPLLLRCHF